MSLGLKTSFTTCMRSYKEFHAGKIGKDIYTLYRNSLIKLIHSRKKQYYSNLFEINNKNSTEI